MVKLLWTTEELNILNEKYPYSSKQDLLKLLPNRAYSAIYTKASNLKIAKIYKKPSKFGINCADNIPPIEIAYMAGFFDGEGCITITKASAHARRKSPAYIMSVGVTNTHEGVIRYFHNYFGGLITGRQPNKKHQKRYDWKICSQKALHFLNIISPYFTVKKEQAKIAIDFQSRMGNGSKQLSNEELDIRHKYYLVLQRMKR